MVYSTWLRPIFLCGWHKFIQGVCLSMNHLTIDSQKLLIFFFLMNNCYLLKRLQKLQRLLKLVGTKLLLEYFTLSELYFACTDLAVLRYWSNNKLSYKRSLTTSSFWLQFIFNLFTFVYDLQFETFSLKRLNFKDMHDHLPEFSIPGKWPWFFCVWWMFWLFSVLKYVIWKTHWPRSESKYVIKVL